MKKLLVCILLSAGLASAQVPSVQTLATQAGVPLATAVPLPVGIPTFTVGSGVTSVVCATGYLCNNTRGTVTIVGGTATTGTIATVTFSLPVTVAPTCFAWMNGGTSFFGIGTSAPTLVAFNVTAGVTVIGATFNVNYLCLP